MRNHNLWNDILGFSYCSHTLVLRDIIPSIPFTNNLNVLTSHMKHELHLSPLASFLFMQNDTAAQWQQNAYTITFWLYNLISLPNYMQIYKAQRNAILCVAACLLYWYICLIPWDLIFWWKAIYFSVHYKVFLCVYRCIYRVCKYYKEIQSVEEVEKRLKDE